MAKDKLGEQLFQLPLNVFAPSISEMNNLFPHNSGEGLGLWGAVSPPLTGDGGRPSWLL